MAAGIGSTIATLLAASGYNLVIAAKTLNDDQQQDAMSSSSTAAASLLAESKHTQAEGKARPSHLQGSLQSVAQAIAAAGHIVHPIKCDVRSADDIQALVQQSLDRFGRIDVLVYNAGAVHWADILNTPTKRCVALRSSGCFDIIGCDLASCSPLVTLIFFHLISIYVLVEC